MGMFSKITNGLAKSRDKFKTSMYDLIGRGPSLDEEFWEGLEETLVLSDVGGVAAMDIVDNLRDESRKRNLPDSYAVLDLLGEQIAGAFAEGGDEIFGHAPQVVLFVGINGTGKTTTVGKIAKAETDAGRKTMLGSADTFRAAAIEQLQVWADRAGVEMVTRERGSDPASVCFETIERAEAEGCDLVLIDTAGRLHTSDDLMRELVKVANVTRKRADQAGMKVFTVLVIDATTGQNGMQQAREFDRALDLDALIVTKLDGTAKGGISLAISHELGLPIVKIGVGEGIDDLREFDAEDFVAALIGDFEEDDLVEDDMEEVAKNTGEDAAQEEPEVPQKDTEAPSPEAASPAEPVDASVAPQDFGGAEAPIGAQASGRAAASLDAETPGGAEAPADAQEHQGEFDTMTWDEFVAYDEARKAEAANKPKKHFWEKW